MNIENMLSNEIAIGLVGKLINYHKKYTVSDGYVLNNTLIPGVFSSEIITNYNDRVRIADVVGCNNDYHDSDSWYELFCHAPRMETSLKLLSEEGYEYYNDDKIKDGISYLLIEGEYFVLEGKHRTCIAKLLNYFDGLEYMKGVRTYAYRIDYAFVSAYHALVDLIDTGIFNNNFVVSSIAHTEECTGNDNMFVQKRKLYLIITTNRGFENWYLNDINKFLYASKLTKFIEYKHICSLESYIYHTISKTIKKVMSND